MSQKLAKEAFRQTFKPIDKELVRWFPGHMDKGLKQMQKKLRSVDCIIEVHDARIPLSGRNTDFKYTITGIKPQILILNKKDMIDKKSQSQITDKLKENQHILFTNCRDDRDGEVRKVLPLAEKLIMNSERFNRSNSSEYNLMIIGVPNVGKSSLINRLRNYHLKKANASLVGAVPGITRSVLNRIKMSENPLVYMFDTPGILTPNIANNESALRLALCATLQDHLVGEIVIADYLLYWLNKHGRFEYVKYLGLETATDEIAIVLAHISKILNKTLKIKQDNMYVIRPDFKSAALHMIRAFRQGDLGKIMLDEDVISDFQSNS